MSVFLENLVTEWEHATMMTDEDVTDYEVDTQLFLESALHIATLTKIEE